MGLEVGLHGSCRVCMQEEDPLVIEGTLQAAGQFMLRQVCFAAAWRMNVVDVQMDCMHTRQS